MQPISASVRRRAKWNTERNVSAVAMARAESRGPRLSFLSCDRRIGKPHRTGQRRQHNALGRCGVDGDVAQRLGGAQCCHSQASAAGWSGPWVEDGGRHRQQRVQVKRAGATVADAGEWPRPDGARPLRATGWPASGRRRGSACSAPGRPGGWNQSSAKLSRSSCQGMLPAPAAALPNAATAAAGPVTSSRCDSQSVWAGHSGASAACASASFG